MIIDHQLSIINDNFIIMIVVAEHTISLEHSEQQQHSVDNRKSAKVLVSSTSVSSLGLGWDRRARIQLGRVHFGVLSMSAWIGYCCSNAILAIFGFPPSLPQLVILIAVKAFFMEFCSFPEYFQW